MPATKLTRSVSAVSLLVCATAQLFCAFSSKDGNVGSFGLKAPQAPR